MSTATSTVASFAEAPLGRAPSGKTRVGPPPGQRRSDLPGRGTGPAARPRRSCPATAVPSHRGSAAVRSCRVEAPASAVRLTDRGIALILTVGLLIVTAALVVIGLTAVTVTSTDYRPAGESALVGG